MPIVPPQVLHCRELGINAMVVMEQYSELDTLLQVGNVHCCYVFG